MLTEVVIGSASRSAAGSAEAVATVYTKLYDDTPYRAVPFDTIAGELPYAAAAA